MISGGSVEWSICLVVLLVGTQTRRTQGNDDINIYSFPSPLYFETGGILSVTCAHPVDLTYSHWEHPNSDDGIISVSRGRFSVRRFNDETSLTVGNAQESDAGDYRCVLNRGAAIQRSRYLTALHRRRVQTHIPDSNHTVSAGQNLTLSCNASFFTLQQWIKDQGGSSRPVVVSNTPDGRIFITPDFQLQFRGISLEDAAMYRCSLRNDLGGTASIIANVKVVVEPSTSVTPPSLEVENGEKASITCQITGFPTPVITWRGATDRVIANPTEGMVVRTVVENSISLISTLTFESVQNIHIGTYTCMARNDYGDHSSSVFLRLAGTPDPPSNVVLAIQDLVNILVNWDTLPSEVDTYSVTWVPRNGTITEPMTATFNSSTGTSYTITNLHRLTLYSVSVYATNSNGRGMRSSPVTITTSATLPGAPSDVIILDVGPSSVRVEWSQNTLPPDDGGSRIRTIRLTYRTTVEEVWSEEEALVVDVGRGFTILSGLRDRTTYMVRMQAGNEIGYGPGAVSESFKTPLPGYPGSPSHVVARNITSSSAVVCWTESAIGVPFTLYSIEIREADAIERAKIVRLSSVRAVPFVQGCSVGAVIPDLQSNTCYQFLVYVTNNQGVGQPSPTSEQYCTLPESNLSTASSLVGMPGFIAGVVVGSVLLIVVVLLLTFCVVMRQWKKSTLKSSMHLPNFSSSSNNRACNSDPRRDSENSASVLIDYNRKASLFSNTSQSDSPDSSQDTPNTSTTIMSNGEINNPFEFPKNSFTHQPIIHPQPVLCPKTANTMEYPQNGSRNGSVAKQFPIYPILEHPPPYPHQLSCTMPSLSQPPPPSRGYHQPPLRCYPSRPGFPNPINREGGGGGEVVMTENPNFEEERARGKIVGMWQNGVMYVKDSEEALPYQGDCMSEVESEISVPFQIPTPHFGESYSTSGYSPVMQRSQSSGRPAASDGGTGIGSTTGGGSGGTGGGGNTSGGGGSTDGGGAGDSSSDGVYQNVTVQRIESVESCGDEDTEFIDNDAYMTFSAPPKFEIQNGTTSGSDIYETVQIKKD